jgi:hypothetical protein
MDSQYLTLNSYKETTRYTRQGTTGAIHSRTSKEKGDIGDVDFGDTGY